MVTAGNVTSSRGIVTTTDFTGWVYQAIKTKKKVLLFMSTISQVSQRTYKRLVF